MARQYLIPGGGYLNETAGRQYLIPGAGYINETQGGGTVYNDVLTETVTSNDSETGIATDNLLLTESGASSDLLNGTATINGSATEIVISTDASVGVASDAAKLTESGTSSDSYVSQTGTVYFDFITENATSVDNVTGQLLGYANDIEIAFSNDNYIDASPLPIVPAVTGGPADGKQDSWDRYLEYKKKKKPIKAEALLEKNKSKYAFPVIQTPEEVTVSAPSIKIEPIKLTDIIPAYKSDIIKDIDYTAISANLNEIWEDEDEEALMMML